MDVEFSVSAGIQWAKGARLAKVHRLFATRSRWEPVNKLERAPGLKLELILSPKLRESSVYRMSERVQVTRILLKKVQLD